MRRLVPLVVLAAAVAGCGGGKTETVTVTTTRTVTVTQTTQASVAARVYLLRDGKVAPVARRVASATRDSLLEALDAGPTPEERAAGFTAPAAGRGRTAAIVYTLTQVDPNGSVEVDGRRYARSDFEDLTPAILVESPLPFAAVSAPLRVTGTANTFEATFDYELLDPAGKVLAHHFVTATSGSGTRGTFDFTIPFEAPNGLGELVVFERSAADGSRLHQVEIPLTLAR
jgi:hypothetical protein